MDPNQLTDRPFVTDPNLGTEGDIEIKSFTRSTDPYGLG